MWWFDVGRPDGCCSAVAWRLRRWASGGPWTTLFPGGEVMADLERVDVLVDWIARRERQHRLTGSVWALVGASGCLLALLSDRFLVFPTLSLAGAAVWLVALWSVDRWCQLRCNWTGHPVVRAEAAWSQASRRGLPAGWYEAPVRGVLHRTPARWVWEPSALVAADLPTMTWADSDVAVATITPLWGPLMPASAQLRLYLRGGGTAEFVVWQPERLMPVVPLGSALTR
jgi:hypothetical protein